MKVVLDRGSPTFSRRALSTKAWRNLSKTPSCTMSREADTHRWPVVLKADSTAAFTARSKSVSSKTMMAFLPPISATTNLL